MAEKVPGWVERLLIPTLESRVRAVVKDEVGHLEKVMDARFKAIDARFEAINARVDSVEGRIQDRFDGIDTRIESLEKRIPMVQDIADLKARLAVVEKRTSG